MARETQAETLGRFRAKIDHAIRWRMGKGYTATWRRLIDAYAGEQIPPEYKGDRALVNMAFAVANIVVASTTTQYPKFTVKATKMNLDDQAVIAEAVLNYLWQHYDCHEEFQQSVVDFTQVGHGWLKVGWCYEEYETDVALSPEQQQAEREARNLELSVEAMSDTEGAGELPSREDVEAEVGGSSTELTITVDDPYVERISPFDVVVDPEAISIRTLRWISHRIVRDLDEVREDKNYDSRVRHKVQADRMLIDTDMDDEPLTDPEMGTDADRVTIWEFYDLRKQTWCVFAQSGDGFLRKPEAIPYKYANPFVMLRNHEVVDRFYPMGDLEVIESLQEELNKTRTQAIDARKQNVRKFIGRASALGPEARQALSSDADGEVVLVEDDTQPLDQILIHAPYLQFDPSIYNSHGQTVMGDIQTVTGLSDYQFAQMPDTRRLATEAMAVQGATNARAQFMLARIERQLAQCGRKLLMLAQQFVDDQRVARISGPGGDMMFQYSGEDIEGEYDLAVEAGSTQPNNDVLRRQEALSLFNTLAPLMGTVIDPVELTRYVLQTGYDIKNVDRFFLQQQAPMPGQEPPPPEGAPPGGMPMGGQVPPMGPGGGPPVPPPELPPEMAVPGGAVPPGAEGNGQRILAGLA